jgi:hypothetical protein
MFIKIAANGALLLEDRDNFRAFKLVVEGPRADIERARLALTGTAELADADTAWVFEQSLRRWPDVAEDAAWQQALTAMIEKAKPFGWIDEQRKAIKAHVEWLG